LITVKKIFKLFSGYRWL